MVPNTMFDYKRLRLFFVSLLWRASISSMPHFKNVKLESKFENEALRILKYPEEDREDLFPVWIFKLRDTHFKPIERAYIDPVTLTFKGVNLHQFVFAGYNIRIKVDEQQVTGLSFLRSDCDLEILEKYPIEELDSMIHISIGHGNDAVVKNLTRIRDIFKTEAIMDGGS